MAGRVFRAVVGLLFPRFAERPEKPFRFSHAVNEAGDYRTDFGAWTPMALRGDPPVKSRAPLRQSRGLHDAILPRIPERAAMARRVLLHWGAVGPDNALTGPEEWEAIEDSLARHSEYANGPDVFPKDERPRFRPRFHAFLMDLCCLALLSAQKVRPEARMMFEADVPPHESFRPGSFPVLVQGRTIICRALDEDLVPIFFVDGAALRTRRFSRLFGVLGKPFREPTEAEREAELHAWLDELVSEEGGLPGHGEFAAMMVDADIASEEIPASILKRMGIPEEPRRR